MKRLQLALLLLLPVSSFAQWGAHSPWEFHGPIKFAALAKQSQSTVVASTANGYLYFSNDFGNTWRHQCLDDTMQLGDVEFFDSLHGIVNASVSEPNSIIVPVIFQTSDGGASWKRINVPVQSVSWRASNATINRLSYPSIDTFYACDEAGIVWRTTNQGSDWDGLLADTNVLNGIYFLDSKTGFIVGNEGCFSKTTDAGETWTRQDIGAGDSTALLGMDFYNRNIGLVYGFGYSYITTDGGASWLFRPTPANAHNVLNTARWVNDHEFFAFGPSIQVYNLIGIDSNMTCTLLDSTIINGITITGSVWNPDYGGLVVSYDGLVIHSQDGFKWNLVSEYDGGLNSTFGNAWYSVGSAFERSTDVGNTWDRFSIGGAGGLGVHFSDSLDGIAFDGIRSASTQTTDGGLTWTNAGLSNTSIGTYVAFSGQTALSVTQPGSQYGQVGDTIFFWKSTDDGRTFTIVGSVPLDLTSSPYPNEEPEQFSIGSVNIIDENTFYAFVSVSDTGVGHDEFHSISHSLLYVSTNGGTLWSRVMNAPTTPNYGGICFLNKNLGFIGCDSGTLFRTTDGGGTWGHSQLTLSPEPSYIYAIGFRDSLHGYLSAVATPDLFATSDGGETWQNDSLVDDNGVATGFMFPDSNTVVALASNGGYYERTMTDSPPANVTVESGLNPFMYIRYYPSPASTDFHFQLDGTYTAQGTRLVVAIYDILGREVLDLSTLANTGNDGVSSFFTANVSSLSSGVYSLRYQLGSSTLTKGLIIIH